MAIYSSNKKPLITFALFAYNQERYIREAIQGAFAQTYEPLEIILSDDCSSDLTFDIIQEETNKYTGPHIIKINRNPRNRGLGGHVNRLMELAEGELIVAAAGDDISLPERTLKIYETYINSGKRARSIDSNVKLLYEKGSSRIYHNGPNYKLLHTTENMVDLSVMHVRGCSHAWHRECFDIFGPLLEGSTVEDRPIAFRSQILGEFVHINESLVIYRLHSSNFTNWLNSYDYEKIEQHTYRACINNILILKNYVKDINNDASNYYLSKIQKDLIIKSISSQLNYFTLKKTFCRGDFPIRLQCIFKGFKLGLSLKVLMKWMTRLIVPPLHKYNLKRKFRKNYLVNMETNE